MKGNDSCSTRDFLSHPFRDFSRGAGGPSGAGDRGPTGLIGDCGPAWWSRRRGGPHDRR